MKYCLSREEVLYPDTTSQLDCFTKFSSKNQRLLFQFVRLRPWPQIHQGSGKCLGQTLKDFSVADGIDWKAVPMRKCFSASLFFSIKQRTAKNNIYNLINLIDARLTYFNKFFVLISHNVINCEASPNTKQTYHFSKSKLSNTVPRVEA